MNRHWLAIGMAVLVWAATTTVSFAAPSIQMQIKRIARTLRMAGMGFIYFTS